MVGAQATLGPVLAQDESADDVADLLRIQARRFGCHDEGPLRAIDCESGAAHVRLPDIPLRSCELFENFEVAAERTG